MPSLELSFFGPPQVTLDGVRIELTTRKALALLAYVNLNRHAHSRDTLASLFWPESPADRAFANLRDTLWVLKKHLTDHWLDIRRHEVALKDEPGLWVDVLEFQRHLDQTNNHEHAASIACAECLPSLLEAIDLYRDEFLRGFTLPDCPAFDEWQASQTDLYREHLVDSVKKVIQYAASQQNFPQAIHYARRWVTLCPWSEAAHRELMRVYAFNHQRSAALQQYQACAQILQEEFGAEPEHETRGLYESILHQQRPGINTRSKRSSGLKPANEGASASLHFEPGGLAPGEGDDALFDIPSEPKSPPNNLPAHTTSFIGRETEISAVIDLISNPDVRLVTLTGPGGSGKTRLGLRVAERVIEHFADGVFFVSLAPISNPDLVVPTMLKTLELQAIGNASPLDVLKRYVELKRMLLVLDNFEQILDAAPVLIDLLEAAPELKMLVTSRTVLRVSGEHEYLVPPMTLPDPTTLPSLECLTQSEAVHLFVERAKAIHLNFALTEENAPTVVGICARLDGLPLAIELAAARVRMFSPGAMLNRLGSPLRFLTGGARDLPDRQHTLRTTIAWSYDLLNEEEQAVFRRLAVFIGGWTLEAAEAICAIAGDPSTGSGQVLDVVTNLESLVDHHLILQNRAQGEARFMILETIREYALERLTEREEADIIRQQHAQFFLTLAEEAEPKLYSLEQAMWSDRLEREHDNLRAVLAWSLDNAIDVSLRLVGALGFFWLVRVHHQEGRDWLLKVLRKNNKSESGADRDKFRVKALNQAGMLALNQGDAATAYALQKEGTALARRLGDTRGLAYALYFLAKPVFQQGKLTQARSLFEESIALFRQIDDPIGLAAALYWHGFVALEQRDDEHARLSCEESIRVGQKVGALVWVASSTWVLGLIAFDQEDYATAQSLIENSVKIYRDTKNTMSIGGTVSILGNIFYAQGNYDRARTCYEESLEIGQRMGNNSWSASILISLGYVSLHQHRWQDAQQCFTESLDPLQECEDRGGIATCLIGMAELLCKDCISLNDAAYALTCAEEPLTTQLEQVVRLLGAADVMLETSESKRFFGPIMIFRLSPIGKQTSHDTPEKISVGQAEYERIVAEVRSALGEEAFTVAWTNGRDMTLEQAIAYALENQEGDVNG